MQTICNMKWLLFMVILTLLTISWSAPIDIEETKTDLANLFTKSYNEAYDVLLKSVENSTSTLNATLKQEFQNASEEVNNFTTKVLQNFEEIPAENLKPQKNEESITAEHNNSLIQTLKSDESIENLTENQETATNIQQQLGLPTAPILNEEPKDDLLKTATESHLESETGNSGKLPLISLLTNEESKQEVVSSTEGSPVENLYHQLANQAQEFTDSVTNQATEQISPILAEFSSKTSIENDFISNKNSETTSNGPVENDLNVTNSSFEENTSSLSNPQETVTVEIYPSTLIFEHSTLDSQAESAQTLKLNESQIFSSELQSVHINPIIPNLNSSEMPEDTTNQPRNESVKEEDVNFKHSIESFTKEHKDIGSDVGQTAKGLVNEAEESLSTLAVFDTNENKSETTEFSPNYPHISNENFIETAKPSDIPPTHNITFKEAVDSFIADVLEIGSSLGLINETDKNQTSSTASPQENETIDFSSPENIQEYTTLPKAGTSDELENQATQNILSNLTPKLENIYETVTTTDSSYLEKSVESLIGSASELGTNIGKTVLNILSGGENINAREQENATEQNDSKIENYLKTVSQDNLSSTTAENIKDVNNANFHTEHSYNEETFTISIPYESQQSVDRTDDISSNLNQEDENVLPYLNQNSELESVNQNPLENDNLILNPKLSSASQDFQEIESITRNPEFSSLNQKDVKIEETSSNQELTSTSLNSAEETITHGTESRNSAEIESTTNNHDLSAANHNFEEFENTTYNPDVKVSYEKSLETQNLNPIKELMSANQDIHELETITEPMDLSDMNQSSQEMATENIKNNLQIFSQEIYNLTSKPELISMNTDDNNVESLSNNPDFVATNQDSVVTHNVGSATLDNIVPPVHYDEYIPVAKENSLDNENRSLNLNLSANAQTEEGVHLSQQSGNSLDSKDDMAIENTTSASKEELTTTITNDLSSTVYTNTDSPKDSTIQENFFAAAVTEEPTPSNLNIKQEASNAFNKFKTTLKNLIDQEKFNKQETQELETTTNGAAIKEEHSQSITTLASNEETTILPKKFEQELQMAVKALEETTHQHFEEFQNNLKETFKKFAILGMEQDKSLEKTTQKPETVEETTFIATTDKENGYSTSQNTVENITVGSLNASKEDSYKNEEPRSGAIHQQFVDTFEETLTTTETSNEREQYLVQNNPLTELPMVELEAYKVENKEENETTEEQITKRSIDLSNTDKDQQYEQTTILSEVGKELPERNLSYNEEKSTTEIEESSTEFMDETTISPVALFVSQSLQENASHVGHNQNKEANDEVATTEAYDLTTEHQPLLKQIIEKPEEEKNSTKVTETNQPKAIEEELITTPYPETTTLQEMVKFIENTETTITSTPIATDAAIQNQQLQQYKELHDNTRPTTLQTQLPLTQASFMEEQQQQIESTTTTTNLAQTPTTNRPDESVTQTTTANTIEVTTPEKIYSTTINESQEEKDETKTESTDVKASVEPEARSLSLIPPKLEYLQNEDGVEVFYGYSIVKHN